MARKVADRRLDSKTERRKLQARGKPYFREIGQGLHLGFRKGQRAGTWVVRLYAGGGRYIVESIGQADDDLTDADGTVVLSWHQAVERARERQKVRTTSSGLVTGPYTVGEAIKDYLDAIAEKASHYDSGKRANLSILPRLGEEEVALLTAEKIRKWHSGLAKSQPRVRGKKGATGESEPRYRTAFDADDVESIRRRRATANRTLTVLKAALNLAFNDGKAASDAAWRRVKPFRGVDAARVRYLTLEEARRLVNASDAELRPLVEAALYTGARYSELARLHVEDFNPDSQTVAVRKSKRSKPRHVELSADAVPFFERLVAGRRGDDLMFSMDDGSEWGRSNQTRRMNASCRRAKIDPPVGIHVLRHTWASHAVMNGMQLLVVATNMGHTDTRMVEKHYGHLAPSYVRDAVRAHGPRFGFEAEGNVSPLAARR